MSSSPDPLLRAEFSPLFSFDVRTSSQHPAERFQVLQRGEEFYLRLHNHPDWLAIVESDARLAQLSSSVSDKDWLGEHLKHKIMNREWGRVLSLVDATNPQEVWRVLWKGKRSFLMRADTDEIVDFRSDDEWKRGAWIQPSAHFAKRFGREWKSPTSDVRGAQAFLQADEEERRLWGLEWTRGSWAELRRVLRAAAIIEHMWGERTVVQSRAVYPVGQRPIGFGSNAPQSGRLLRLIERLEERNVAVLRDKMRLRRLAPRPFAFEFGVARWPELRVAVDEPSEHEKMEARLELREWLRAEAPDLVGEWDS